MTYCCLNNFTFASYIVWRLKLSRWIDESRVYDLVNSISVISSWCNGCYGTRFTIENDYCLWRDSNPIFQASRSAHTLLRYPAILYIASSVWIYRPKTSGGCVPVAAVFVLHVQLYICCVYKETEKGSAQIVTLETKVYFCVEEGKMSEWFGSNSNRPQFKPVMLRMSTYNKVQMLHDVK